MLEQAVKLAGIAIDAECQRLAVNANLFEKFGLESCRPAAEKRARLRKAKGKSDKETAESVGVARQSVTEWRNGNPGFIAKMRMRRADLWGAQVECLRGLDSIAVTVLQDDLLSDDVEVKRKAASYSHLESSGVIWRKPDT